MIRVIIKREIKDGYNGLVDTGYETLDVDAPELEGALTGGGFSEKAYDHRSLVGVEILPARRAKTKEADQYDTGMGTTPGMWEVVSEELDGEKLPDSVSKAIHALANGLAYVQAKEGKQ